MQGQRAEPAGFRPDIEGLRAVAVVAVVLFHAEMPGVHGGFVGVDVFFVISGFLITGLLWREVHATGSVLLRRFYG
ncbi:acyltransferase family protein, partial [Mycobacterium alsense]|uniref:acyltransferase family protein n=1 Tax=Mycobacterium alsense TaxID=324058 RepID=UPI0030FE65F1